MINLIERKIINFDCIGHYRWRFAFTGTDNPVVGGENRDGQLRNGKNLFEIMACRRSPTFNEGG